MIQIYSTTDPGLVRQQNEDNLGTAETPNGTVCVVCDGMGGHAGGATASKIAVDCILQFLSKEKYADIRAALKEALEFANMQILGAASETPELQGMGTTACVLVEQDDKVWIAHAGDSRIYLYVAKGKCLHRLTKDHSYVQGLVERGIIYQEEAENHPDKNRILKALGVKEELKPEISEKPILPAKDDIFLICSDGLSGMVSDKDIEKILSDKTDMKTKEIALMSAAKASGGTDNITFQLLHVTQSPHRNSVFESKEASLHTLPPKEGVDLLQIRNYAIIAAAIIAITLPAGIWIGGKINDPPKTDEKIIIAVDTVEGTKPVIDNDPALPILKKDTSLSGFDVNGNESKKGSKQGKGNNKRGQADSVQKDDTSQHRKNQTTPENHSSDSTNRAPDIQKLNIQDDQKKTDSVPDNSHKTISGQLKSDSI
jgi:serine/threonine protein phosphatase PrpC